MKADGQKMKLFVLKEILEQETDAKHGITMARILELLSIKGQPAERKSVYHDINAFRDAGVLDITKAQGQNREYAVVSRDFDPDEVKLLVDAVQASKFLSDAKTKTLVYGTVRLYDKYGKLTTGYYDGSGSYTRSFKITINGDTGRAYYGSDIH